MQNLDNTIQMDLSKVIKSNSPSAFNLKMALALCELTPSDILAHLATDEEFTVIQAVMRNPNATNAIHSIGGKSEHLEVRCTVSRQIIPAFVFEEMKTDPLAEVRVNLAKNPYAPKSTLETLSNDPEHRVSQPAIARLTGKGRL